MTSKEFEDFYNYAINHQDRYNEMMRNIQQYVKNEFGIKPAFSGINYKSMLYTMHTDDNERLNNLAAKIGYKNNTPNQYFNITFYMFNKRKQICQRLVEIFGLIPSYTHDYRMQTFSFKIPRENFDELCTLAKIMAN